MDALIEGLDRIAFEGRLRQALARRLAPKDSAKGFSPEQIDLVIRPNFRKGKYSLGCRLDLDEAERLVVELEVNPKGQSKEALQIYTLLPALCRMSLLSRQEAEARFDARLRPTLDPAEDRKRDRSAEIKSDYDELNDRFFSERLPPVSALVVCADPIANPWVEKREERFHIHVPIRLLDNETRRRRGLIGTMALLTAYILRGSSGRMVFGPEVAPIFESVRLVVEWTKKKDEYIDARMRETATEMARKKRARLEREYRAASAETIGPLLSPKRLKALEREMLDLEKQVQANPIPWPEAK